MENSSIVNSLSLAGMILGIISAAYGAIMYLLVWAIMASPVNGPVKAIIAVVIGIILSIVALVLSKTAQKKGATSKTYKAGTGTGIGGLIVCSALLVISIVYIIFVLH